MSLINFGMSFVLKGVNHARVNAKVMVDGLFQIDLPGKRFHFITKCTVVHSVSFTDLYDARGNPDNKYVIVMLFNSAYPCELHAQNENERAIVASLLQDIISKRNVDVGDKLRQNNVTKTAWVKKKGKVLAAKRLLHLSSNRRCVIVFKTEAADDVLPSYHILLHHRVTIVPRKAKGIQIVGTYKNIFISFTSKAVRDEWLEALQALKEPPPAPEVTYSSALMIEPRVQYMPDQGPKRYPQPYFTKAHAGPSAY